MRSGYKGHLTIAFAIFSIASLIRGANATIFTNPQILNPGETITTIPDGYSGADFISIHLFSIPFAFTAGPSGTLYEYIDQYPPVVDPAHPYGSDYHFGYEITLTSGEVSSFSVDGYAPLGVPFDVSVKQCGLSMCAGIGSANGVAATEVSRTTDGDEVTFSLAGLSGDGAHSAGLELFTNATSYGDPHAIFEDSEGNLFSISVPGPIAVPEPTTWLMMLIGLIGLGFARYRTSIIPAREGGQKVTSEASGVSHV